MSAARARQPTYKAEAASATAAHVATLAAEDPTLAEGGDGFGEVGDLESNGGAVAGCLPLTAYVGDGDGAGADVILDPGKTGLDEFHGRFEAEEALIEGASAGDVSDGIAGEGDFGDANHSGGEVRTQSTRRR